jgi:3-deoxy-D-manno-octulosonic-acid transferase
VRDRHREWIDELSRLRPGLGRLGAGLRKQEIPWALALYSTLTTALLVLVSPAVLVGLMVSPDKWRDRLGIVRGVPRRSVGEKRRVWLHASSVGEVRATTKLVREICRDSKREVVFSTMTPAGNWAARRYVEGPSAFFFLPLDTPLAARRAVRAIDADSLVLVETEVWPQLIMQAKRRGMKVAVVNGKLSDKAVRRYRTFGFLFRHVFGLLDAVLAQSKENGRNFELMGTPRDRITVTGNTKQDAQEADQQNLGMREKLGWSAGDVVLTAGSTRPGEESVICESFVSARMSLQTVRLVLAPRHLKRVEQVAGTVSSHGLRMVRWSQAREATGAGQSGVSDVLVLDTLGDLPAVYRESDIAFVGGTLSGHGGHNILEPASAGLVILAGPSRANIHSDSRVLFERGALVSVETPRDISDVLLRLAGSQEERKRRAGEALDFYRSRPVASKITFLQLEKAGII